MTSRRLEVEVIGDSRLLEKAFGRASKSAKKFNDDVTKSGRTGAAFGKLRSSVLGVTSAFVGGAGFVAAAKSSVDAASDLNEQISKSNAVFGRNARTVQKWSKTMAKSHGLSSRAALEAAGSLGALFKPVGLTGKVAAEQSRKLTELGGDLASFYNTDVQDALDAIRSGIVGESEPLRRYGVLLSEARVQQEALTETGKKHTEQLTSQDKLMARIALIYKDTATAQGDFARTSGGLANQQRILQANLENVKAMLGQALLPTINDLVKGFNNWISKSKNQKTVLDTVQAAAAAVKSILAGIKTVMTALNKITGSTTNTLKLLFAVLVAYKGLQLAGSLAKIASNIGLIGARARDARTGVQGLRLSLIGKAGLVAAVGIASYEITKLILRLTGLDKKLGSFGGKIYDWTHPGAAGPRLTSAAASRYLRNQAKRLEARGMSKQQTYAYLARTHPGVPRSDIAVYAGLTVSGGIHLYGVQNVRQMEHELAKRAKARPRTRRGAR